MNLTILSIGQCTFPASLFLPSQLLLDTPVGLIFGHKSLMQEGQRPRPPGEGGSEGGWPSFRPGAAAHRT